MNRNLFSAIASVKKKQNLKHWVSGAMGNAGNTSWRCVRLVVYTSHAVEQV